jgi:hypothetical protein
MTAQDAVRVVPDGRKHAMLVLGYPDGGEVHFEYGTRAEMRDLRDHLVHSLAAFAAGTGRAPEPDQTAPGQTVEARIMLRPVDDTPPWWRDTPADRLADVDRVLAGLRGHLTRALAHGLAVVGYSVGGDHFAG